MTPPTDEQPDTSLADAARRLRVVGTFKGGPRPRITPATTKAPTTMTPPTDEQPTDEQPDAALAHAARAMAGAMDEGSGTTDYDQVSHDCLAAIGALLTDRPDRETQAQRLLTRILERHRHKGFITACTVLSARATTLLPYGAPITLNVDLEQVSAPVRESFESALPLAHDILTGLSTRDVGIAYAAIGRLTVTGHDIHAGDDATALAVLVLLAEFTAEQHREVLRPVTDAWNDERPD